MLARLKKSMDEKDDQGFTLIELLVVIIIIGILAAIAIPVFLNQRQKGVDAGIKSDVKSLATIAETIATDDPTGAATTAAYYTVTGTLGSNLVTAGATKTTGNNIAIAGSPSQGYCIRGYNSGGSLNAATKAVWYDSSLGGMQPQGAQPTTGLCAAGSITTLKGFVTLP